ncbi:MAG TPA: hypothetical protein VFV08_01600 [Puia sp.]|nr:hypothetical protein [Puia sp.]
MRSVIEEYEVTSENIYNIDETAMFIETDDLTTIDKVGTKKVAVISAGLTRFRITGICAASASGRKLAPTIITKGKTESITMVDGFVSLTALKSWINSNLFRHWIDFMFPSFVTPANKILLVFDSAKSHISSEVKAFLWHLNIMF